MNQNFQLEFVDPGLYYVQDENNFRYPLLQVGSGSDEKKSRIRIRKAKNQRIRPDPDSHP